VKKKSMFFVIGKEPARFPALIVSIGVFVLLIVLWALSTNLGWISPIFLPSPQSVVNRMWSMWQNGTLATDIQVSFLLSSVMAIVVGVIAGCYGFWKSATEPLMDFVRYMPVVAFVPLTILWSGTGDIQKFLIIWIGTFFQQVLMVMDAVKRVPQDFVGLGRTLGMSDRKILLRIIMPSAFPAIWDALRITFGHGHGWCWPNWSLQPVGLGIGLSYRNVSSRPTRLSDTSCYSVYSA